MLQLGLLLKQVHGDVESAEECYRNAIKHDQQYAHAWLNLGVLLKTERRDFAGAEQAYRRAIKIDPLEPWVHYNLGRLLLEARDDVAGADALFRKFVKLAPDADEAQKARDAVDAARKQHRHGPQIEEQNDISLSER